MPTQISGIFRQIKETVTKLGKKTRWIIIITALAVVALSIALTYYLNRVEYVPLFSELSEIEAAEVSAQLYQSGISYNIKGSVIYVPAANEMQARAQLALAGYPKGGFGYETFWGNLSMLSTNFEMESAERFYLQDRLAATICLFEGVKNAVVTINPGREQITVIDRNAREATANVTVTMKEGHSLTSSQAKAIQRLVSTSIRNAPSMENVSVIDQNGFDWSSPDAGTSISDTAVRLKLSIEKEIEAKIAAKVANILTPIYGPEKISVSADCTYNIDKKLSQMIEYYTDEGRNEGYLSSAEGGAAGSTDGGTVGGLVGATPNTDIPYYPGITVDGNELYFSNDWSYNYLVNQLAEEIQSDAGFVADLSVAVALDVAALDDDTADGLRQLIASASGIEKADIYNKITLFALSFYRPDAPEDPAVVIETDPWAEIMWYVVIGLGALMVIITLVFFIIIRSRGSKLKRARGEIEAARAIAAAAVAEAPIKQAEIENKRNVEVKEQIRVFTDNNPEISAQMIKTWLKGGDAVE